MTVLNDAPEQQTEEETAHALIPTEDLHLYQEGDGRLGGAHNGQTSTVLLGCLGPSHCSHQSFHQREFSWAVFQLWCEISQQWRCVCMDVVLFRKVLSSE